MTHTLILDRPNQVPGQGGPINLRVGAEGRLRAVLEAGILPPVQTAVLRHKASNNRQDFHDTGKHHVSRHEDLGRYDPISSTLTFKSEVGGEHSIKVGAGGRLHAALASGKVTAKDAMTMGITPEEYRLGRAQTANPETFNPITMEGTRRVGRADFHQSSKRTGEALLAARWSRPNRSAI